MSPIPRARGLLTRRLLTRELLTARLATRRLLTCVLLALAVLGGAAVPSAAAAPAAGRASVTHPLSAAQGTVRALGRPGATTSTRATRATRDTRHIAEPGTPGTVAPSEPIARSTVRSSAHSGPSAQVLGALPSRRGPPQRASSVLFVVDDLDAASATDPSPAAARAPPASA
jgi:hypothetical protein